MKKIAYTPTKANLEAEAEARIKGMIPPNPHDPRNEGWKRHDCVTGSFVPHDSIRPWHCP